MTEIKLPSVDTTEGSQLAYSHSSSLARRRSCTSFSVARRTACEVAPIGRTIKGISQSNAKEKGTAAVQQCPFQRKSK